MNKVDLVLGWLWGGNNQLASYELWKLTVGRLVHDDGQIPCPAFLALWCTDSAQSQVDHLSSEGISRDIQLALRGLRDALDFRLQREPMLARARRFAGSLPKHQAALSHAFILNKWRLALGLPITECEPAEFRSLPSWLPVPSVPALTGSPALEASEAQIARMQNTTERLVHAQGFFSESDWQLLSLGMAHLSASEQVVALEVLDALRWFDLNRRTGPSLLGVGESITPITAALAEDYPTGGIDSISQRGPWENLVPSELAYLDDRWPSLFEIRWLNRELLFHGRDESVHRRPVLDWWIRVDARVADWLFRPEESPYRLAPMILGFALSLVLRLRKAFGEWDFRIRLETPRPLREIKPGKQSHQGGFLSFLELFARRLGFERGKPGFDLGNPGGNRAEVAQHRHKLILMDLGGCSEGMDPDLHLALYPLQATAPTTNALCWDHPRTAADWLELDVRIMRRLPVECLQGKGEKR